MRAVRCGVCGEVLLGETAPSRCPYCAADGPHLRDYEASTGEPDRMLPTETERRDLEDLAEVARILARCALGAAGASADDGRRALLERIGWIHAEHVRVLCLLADEVHGPEWLIPVAVEDDEALALRGIEMRLAEATRLYERAASRATAPRVGEVFTAFAEAEAALAAFLRRAHAEPDG